MYTKKARTCVCVCGGDLQMYSINSMNQHLLIRFGHEYAQNKYQRRRKKMKRTRKQQPPKLISGDRQRSIGGTSFLLFQQIVSFFFSNFLTTVFFFSHCHRGDRIINFIILNISDLCASHRHDFRREGKKLWVQKNIQQILILKMAITQNVHKLTYITYTF